MAIENGRWKEELSGNFKFFGLSTVVIFQHLIALFWWTFFGIFVLSIPWWFDNCPN